MTSWVWWQGALGELHATVDAAGLQQTGVSGGLYASDIFQHDCGHATVFIPVDGAVRRIGRVTPITVPPASWLSCATTGRLTTST